MSSVVFKLTDACFLQDCSGSKTRFGACDDLVGREVGEATHESQ